MQNNDLTAVLLLSCPDRLGLVSTISEFICKNGGNILSLSEHVDRSENMFSIRIAWDMKGFGIPENKLKDVFKPIAECFAATWKIHFLEKRQNVAIFVSKYDHCLLEMLWRHKMNEFPINISLIISNHMDMKYIADQHNVPFHYYPITPENKTDQERLEMEILKKNNIGAIILARYMQILSPEFIEHYENRIINIHHSFLPAFIGANPYQQAYQRGVKITGATCHYVTKELDEGPIIAQDVIHISHKDTLKDLIRKGRDLERLVLARGVQLHFEHRVLVKGIKTIIFD